MSKEDSILKKIEAGIHEGSAKIAEEIAFNVEKYGVAPIMSIDGKLKNLRPTICDLSDLKKAQKLLKKHGYQDDDFYLLEDKNVKYKEEKKVLVKGYVVCVCKKSGKLKEYKANGGSSWIDDFALDLENNFFK